MGANANQLDDKHALQGALSSDEGFEYFCDMTDAKIDVRREARYHYGSEEDGLDISVAAYGRYGDDGSSVQG